ncbi:25-hydroxycholesterol 7-alpha-hydroxylase [Channa argus]|uniref:25-hydroxycholesterol 7-alpha-hydroxylase n=1 Tax=Channa argus TaxID=215402 RepID=A0A6G1Q8B4_CHAAH|nr:25-hydroxycholesterol 7-alpha-hydroxylase [Channa argus]KAF3698518.1 25-hydroxycholesterol 7-alpha-hydroxylase [Channa argus]
MSSLLLILLGLLSLLLCVLRRRTRREGEPPLIRGFIPYIGKALQFGKDAHRFLEAHRKKYGDIFTVHIAGRYMTFIMDPLMYPSIIKQGRQLDFHEFSNKVAPFTFGYPPIVNGKFPGLNEQIKRSFNLLQGDGLNSLTESMMGNLMLLFHQDHLEEGGDWKRGSMFDFCFSIMFEATFLTLYGRPASGCRHSGMGPLREDFLEFDSMFPLLIAQIPIWLLGRTKAIRKKLINYFLLPRMSHWSNTSQFIKIRAELFEQYDTLCDVDKGAHHFAILWASVGNTGPATFWAMYYLVSHPDALEAVQQEIHGVLRLSDVEFSSDRDVKLSREQLDKLHYLESAINESLRLSSASTNIRVAQEDFSLRLDAERSVSVRKGDIIALYPQSMHLDPEIYEDPQTFRFDRYMQDGKEKTDFYKGGQKLKYYLMPFGSGSTMCPGRFFALNEIKQFLCLLLLYFDLELEEGQSRATLDPSRAGLGVLLPATDVRFRYRPRTV